jgi:phenylalanine-4-hydroxylase
MATVLDRPQDFSSLPDMAETVYTAPLKKPDHIGDDWLEPTQTEYSSEDDAIWDDLFARQMEVLPGRRAADTPACRR